MGFNPANLERRRLRPRGESERLGSAHNPVYLGLANPGAARPNLPARPRNAGLGLLTLALAVTASAGVLHPADKLTDDEKIALVRDLSAEYAVVKSTLPRSRKPLEFSSDSTWDQKEWQKLSQTGGAAARIGDKVQITKIALDGDHLVLEINGGLKDGKKWYDHIQAGIGAANQPIAQTDSTAKYGTSIDVDFHKPMESLTAAEVKRILAPVLEFDKRTVTQIYTESLPPKVRQAITEKRAEVGMDRDQVQLALGHPERKYRESKDGVDTEDWIYGTPPGKITFVTFTGSKVTRVKDEYAGLGLETSPN
jgi:hypothetical protein